MPLCPPGERYAEVLFTTATGALASFSCIVDTGAPFSVLPFSLWQSYNVQWNPLGQQLTRQGQTGTRER